MKSLFSIVLVFSSYNLWSVYAHVNTAMMQQALLQAGCGGHGPAGIFCANTLGELVSCDPTLCIARVGLVDFQSMDPNKAQALVETAARLAQLQNPGLEKEVNQSPYCPDSKPRNIALRQDTITCWQRAPVLAAYTMLYFLLQGSDEKYPVGHSMTLEDKYVSKCLHVPKKKANHSQRCDRKPRSCRYKQPWR